MSDDYEYQQPFEGSDESLSDDVTLEWCRAVVYRGVGIEVSYKWSTTENTGSHRVEERTVETYTDDEIRETVAAHIGAEGFEENIEVIWD